MREAIISSIANGHNSLSGYRSVWHALRLKRIQVPRVVVQEFLREIDPEGTEHNVCKEEYTEIQVQTTHGNVM